MRRPYFEPGSRFFLSPPSFPFPPPTSPLKVGSVIWNRAGKYKALRITEMGREIEKGERERRSFEHVAVRSITNVGVGEGLFLLLFFPPS